jgi:glutaredoxin
MLDTLRTTLHRVITTPRGDDLGPVRLPKMFARRLNSFLGRPLCSAEEISARRAAKEKLAHLGTSPAVKAPREPAPVVVYYEKDRNQRLLDRIGEALKARDIAYKCLDVAGDEATMAFVTRAAKCEEDDLPIVFVAGTAVGGYNELVEWDVSGRLQAAVLGQ